MRKSLEVVESETFLNDDLSLCLGFRGFLSIGIDKMTSIYDIEPGKLIEKLSEELKSYKEIKAPIWAAFVKTGLFKERPPVQEGWWNIRAAAILRSIAKLGPVGTSKLRRKYGGKKNRGVRPEHFYKGSGSIIRKILQQLEKAGLIKQVEKGVHKGRVLTPKGDSLIHKTVASLKTKKPVKKEIKVMEKIIPKKPEGKEPSKVIVEKEVKVEDKESSNKAEETKIVPAKEDKKEIKEKPKKVEDKKEIK